MTLPVSKFIIPATLAGKRLDQCLVALNFAASLRGARRLLKDGALLCNGKKARGGQIMAQGDTLWPAPLPPLAAAPKARLLFARKHYYCFFKPAFLHTAALAGRANASLERQMPEILAANGIVTAVRLLQRLDFQTSGLVLGTDCAAAAEAYGAAENNGLISKFYLARLEGVLEKKIIVKNALNCNGGAKARILPEEAPSPRWTVFEPVGYEKDATIVRCVINKGQRHQIRAHARVAGFPLLGDALYGAGASDGFLLCHYRLILPGAEFAHLPSDLPLAAEVLAKPEFAELGLQCT